jgi:hypothetical protein
LQPGEHPITGQPTVHPRAKAGRYFFQQLRQLKGAKTAQVAHIHMPQRLSFTDEPSPGAGVLPALHSLMHRGRMAGVSAGGNSHCTQSRSFIHTMAANATGQEKQRFSFLEMKENQRSL